MNLEISMGSVETLTRVHADALIIPVPDQTGRKFALQGISVDVFAQIEEALQDGDFKTTVGHCLLLKHLPDMTIQRLLLVGAGSADVRDLGKAMAAAVRELGLRNVKLALVNLECMQQIDAAQVEAMVIAACDASYAYSYMKRAPSDDGKKALKKLIFVGADTDILKQGVAMGNAIASGMDLARDWANRPANLATPAKLAQAALELAKAHKRVSAQVLMPKDVEKLGMGALLAVAQGTAEPLRFVILKYQGAASGAAPVVLVGKGITFDSGGISLKPAAAMDEMKFDMCGAASVLGAISVVATLKLPLNVVGLIPSCENLPDGKAIKPGDVVTSMSGQTIEILNTDAEGRLILCDALTYAERFKPQAVVDMATLTGACVVALGKVRSGLFSNELSLSEELCAAGERSGDLCWPMPLDDDYAVALKSRFADVANVGGRDGGAITAALFLKRFARNYPWAHLDIAGTAYKGGADKGATGRPVPLLAHFLFARANQMNVVHKMEGKLQKQSAKTVKVKKSGKHDNK